MKRERLIKEFGSHWQVDKNDDVFFVKEQPGRLDLEEDGDRRFNDVRRALDHIQAKEMSAAASKVARLRNELYALEESLLLAIWLLVSPRGAAAVSMADLRKRLADAERDYAAVRKPDFTNTIIEVPLPEEVSVPECLALGSAFWVVKADWMGDREIRLHKATVTSASFYPSWRQNEKEQFDWSVKYYAEDEVGGQDVSFEHKNIDPETGDVHLHVVGWTGHLTRDRASERLAAIADGLRRAADNAIALAQKEPAND